jgi:toxin ParE1/3/4
MPNRVEFTRRAIADMEAIEEYGRRKHGAEQAGLYREALLSDMAMMLDFPALGPVAGARGLRRKPCGVHVIFYRTEGDVLRIVRILHQRMEPSRHL